MLGIAFVFDGISFITAYKEFNIQRGTTPFWLAVKKSKDPSTFVVLFEDAADLLGLITAFLGVYLGHLYQNPVYDAVASIVIGVILTAVSILLTRESRSLLMGESAGHGTLRVVKEIAEDDPTVKEVISTPSMYLSPEEILLLVCVSFHDNCTSVEITEAIQRIRKNIRQKFPAMKQIFVQTGVISC